MTPRRIVKLTIFVKTCWMRKRCPPCHGLQQDASQNSRDVQCEYALHMQTSCNSNVSRIAEASIHLLYEGFARYELSNLVMHWFQLWDEYSQSLAASCNSNLVQWQENVKIVKALKRVSLKDSPMQLVSTNVYACGWHFNNAMASTLCSSAWRLGQAREEYLRHGRCDMQQYQFSCMRG